MNRADECRAILDAHRIARCGVASGYRLIDVEQALTAWEELHGVAA